MSYQRKNLCTCRTDGSSLWSRECRNVIVKKIELLAWDDDEYNGEMRVFFSKRSWNIYKHGYIYTDKGWISDFRKYLRTLGFSNDAVNDVDYSEQGMQEDNYVSLDAGDIIIKEQLNPVLRFVKGHTVKNDVITVIMESSQ